MFVKKLVNLGLISCGIIHVKACLSPYVTYLALKWAWHLRLEQDWFSNQYVWLLDDIKLLSGRKGENLYRDIYFSGL